MPLTRGHCHLIDTALAQVEHLTILVCSLPHEPIPGHLRYGWVRETYPQARVVHVTDELPSYPYEHPDFWAVWRDSILAVAPVVEVLFTSEDYGDPLAAALGCRHVLVDRARATVPISATRVRADPLAHWEYLPACVRPYYAKRILISGPESTGKTTLARHLAEHYGTVWVPEYARGYIDDHGGRFDYADIARIAFGQAETEEALARQANRLLICDTDLVTTTIYSEHYFGRCPHIVQRLADERRYDLVLLLDIDLPWAADLQRDLPHRRAEFRDRFLHETISRRLPYVVIRGQGQARLAAAIAAVDRLLQRA